MSSNRRRRPPAPRPAPAPMTVDEAYDLGDDLLRALTPMAGEPAQVDQLLTRWLDTYDTQRFTLITSAALRTVFANCLHPVPLAEIPPGALTFTDPKETTSA